MDDIKLEKSDYWEEYKINIDLYKHYYEMVIKFNIFYYAITGAILSFYFANTQYDLIRYSLVLPFLMSFIFSFYFFYAACRARNFKIHLLELGQKDLGIKSVPEINILKYALKIFGVLQIIVALSILSLFILNPGNKQTNGSKNKSQNDSTQIIDKDSTKHK